MRRPLRVLIVEDSEDDMLLLVRELRRGGYEPEYERVETAVGMREALERQSWDLVISDYAMPRFSAPGALDVLRAGGWDIPFILVSGAIGEERAVELLKAGAHDFISKNSLTRLNPAIERELAQEEVRRGRKQAEEKLRLLAAAVAAAANAIFITNRQGIFLWANQAFERLTGYSRDELNGKTPQVLKSGKQGQAFYKEMWDTILAGKVWRGEVIERRKDGSFYIVQQTIAPIQDTDGAISTFVAVHEDITQRKEAEARVEYMAYHDPLTGLPNRALFQDRLQQAIAHAQREGRWIALHFIDLDQFKIVNDTLGHPVGDVMLQAVAERLQSCVRSTDTVARLGGDEFAVLQTDLQRPEGAARLAAKIIEVLAQPLRLSGQDIHSTASVGITVYPVDDSEGTQLLQNADLAMYLAKSEGRNTFRFFTPALNEQVRARRAMEMDLHDALASNQFTLHYQAQVDLADKSLVGMEALLRWQHPVLGLVKPADFISVAEESGLIVPIGKTILQKACIQNRTWQKAGFPPHRMAVNISAANLKNGELVSTVKEALKISDLEPHYLELELTETTLMRDEKLAARTMRELRQMGIFLSIDDFGTGYSSLNYLRRLSINKLKIDQSFVRQLPQNADDAVIVKTIIELGHALGLKVIAEGVENADQVAFLMENGCDEGQGYFFGKPVPAEEFIEYLKTGASMWDYSGLRT